MIAGDLTDEHDHHSSRLVNRLVAELVELARDGVSIHILRGNHDYTEASNPFFLFLAQYPNCFYYNDPRIVEIGNKRWAFFPHAKKPDWSGVRYLQDAGVDFVCCHQLFTGAVGESGSRLSGEPSNALVGPFKVWAGDIHTPQCVGPVEYVGAPYPIHFGDSYEPRVVLLDGEVWRNLYPPSIQKLLLRITDPAQLEYNPVWVAGDQVKIELTLRRSEFDSWDKYRRKIQSICARNELVLCGIELKEKRRERLTGVEKTSVPRAPQEQFDAYVKQLGIDESDVVIGRELL